ncbi:hypothetical protein J3F83DRAFT_739901 [Trichoderma novae-zelandiae]
MAIVAIAILLTVLRSIACKIIVVTSNRRKLPFNAKACSRMPVFVLTNITYQTITRLLRNSFPSRMSLASNPSRRTAPSLKQNEAVKRKEKKRSTFSESFCWYRAR